MTQDPIERRAWLVIALIPVLVLLLLGFAAWQGGWLSPYARHELITANAKGLSPRTPVTYAGLAIGEVERMAVQDDGRVRVVVRIREADNRWIGPQSVFTVDRPLVGAASIRVDQDPQAAPVAPGQPRELQGQADGLDLAQLGDRANRVLQRLEEGLAEFQSVMARANGRYGVLQAVTGSEAEARALLDLVRGLQQTNRQAGLWLQELRGTTQRVDQRLTGPQGVADEAVQTLRGLQALLLRTQALVDQAGGVVQTLQTGASDAGAVLRDVKAASADLDQLRGEIESNLRQIQDMTATLQQRWPFATPKPLALP